jgi:methylmalonyl-CoA mutase N-terminal domain/subunit
MEVQKEEKKYFTRSVAAYEVNEFYAPDSLESHEAAQSKRLGLPGQYPYTRGIAPDLYRKNPWVVRIYAGFGVPEAANIRFKQLIELGAEGISVALDLPSQIGLDSDHPLAEGEVGRVGVAIDSLRDMELLFEGIAIDQMRQIGMLANSIGPIGLALFIAMIEKRGFPLESVVVELQNDVLKEFIVRGTQIFPLLPSIRVATDVVRYCAEKKLYHWRPMNVCGAHMSAAGTSWEMAFAFENAKVYFNDLIDKGMKIDEFARLLVLFLNIDSGGIDLFESVAKARAARRIWATLLKEQYGSQDEASQAVRLFAFIIAGATAQQPINNISRIALGAQAAVLAGVQFLHTACWDEGLTIPSEEAVKVAIRTQQILRHETGSVTAVADPLGGSYFLEDLTDRVEKEVLSKMKVIEDMGGAIKAVEKGFYQKQIGEGSARVQKEIWNGTRGVVGVNLYREKEDKIPLGKFKIDPETERQKIEALKKLRKGRNNVKLKETLQRVRAAAESDENLVPPILAAVKEYATIGEICDKLREVFGEYSEGAVYI